MRPKGNIHNEEMAKGHKPNPHHPLHPPHPTPTPTPRIQIHLFENLLLPILLYGNDISGVTVSVNMLIDKLFNFYIHCVLHAKATMSNTIVVGEWGQLPPSIYGHINASSYFKMLKNLIQSKVVKQVFDELNKFHSCRVRTWVMKACELAGKYDIDMQSNIWFQEIL